MTYFWMALGFIAYIVHSSYTVHFSINVLKYAQKNQVLLLLFPIINASVFTFAYLFEVPYYALYAFSGILYFIEFRVLAKTSLRQIWMLVITFLLNIAGVHLIVLIITGSVTNLTISEVYDNESIFFKTVAIAHIILFFMLYCIEKRIPRKTLTQVTVAKFYSETLSVVTTFLFVFINIDMWFMLVTSAQGVYTIFTIISVLCSIVLFFCLFFFNIHITNLQHYKRKADEIKVAHEKVLEKKNVAEFKLYRDDLTKLYNRRFMDRKIDELCNDANAEFGLVYADLAALKYVNDTFGHKAGDRYITKVAHIIKTAIREEDFSARIGGDEFLIVLTEITKEELKIVVKRIQKTIETQSANEKYKVYANLGYEHFAKNREQQSRVQVLEIVENFMKIEKESYYREGGR